MSSFKFRYSNSQKGFTLLEMVIVIILISTLGVITYNRIWKYRVYAEEAAVTAIIGNIRSALGLEVASLAVRGQAQKISILANTNPIDLLAQKPHNYIGETFDARKIKDEGIWYFDKNDHTLNYVVSYKEQFKSNIKGIKRTSHQLKMVYRDNNNNNRFDKGIDYINGLDLVTLEPYRWIIEKKR